MGLGIRRAIGHAGVIAYVLGIGELLMNSCIIMD
jgi:hypothetical protein